MTTQESKRKLAAILSADVKGYSRLMSQDEETTVKILKEHRATISGLVSEHRGRVVDAPGDNLLAEFGSVVDAVKCAVKIQESLKGKNAELPENKRMEFRIGVNLGDVIEDEGRVYGDGVNIAARLEGLAEPGGISISGTVYDQVENRLGVEYEYLGMKEVKNITKPVRVYRVRMESRSAVSEMTGALEVPEKPSIAVLPFVNMSGDPEQEYFSDGITEDIITSLSRSPWLFVIARNSSFSYRGKSTDVRTVSKELGVRYILEGSVRKSGNKLRVTAQLVDGILGNHVWAEKYDGELHDIFDFQDEITKQIVASTSTQVLLDMGHKVRRLERPDIKTWDLVARGWRLFYELTKESLIEAEMLFRKAVALSPKSSEAHFLLAGVLIHHVHMDFTSQKRNTMDEAYQLAKTALNLGASYEYAHWVMGIIELYRRNHDKSVAEFERAIELNPNCSLAYGSLGTALSYSGEVEESIKNSLMAIRLNPKDFSIFFRFGGIAIAHYVGGRYSEAENWARKSVYRKSEWHIGHAMLAASLAQLDRAEEAQEAVRNYIQNFPNANIHGLLDLLPFKYSTDARRLEEGLRKAGLPE
jgi:TolB-like protein/class 3 adenylate cyclase